MKRILIVNDDPDEVRELESCVQDSGFQAELITRWQVVYKMALEIQPDLIILQAMISGIDGRFICGHLKGSPETCHIPVFLITDQARAHSLEDYGIDRFITRESLQNDLFMVLG